MKKKGLIILFSLVLIELVIVGFVLLKPFAKTANVETSQTKESTEKLLTSTTMSSSNEKTRKEAKWIESDTEIAFPILMYHSLAEPEGNSLKVPPKEFEEHMKWLKDNGYYTLTPEEAYIVLTENKKPAEKIVWVTFDDGYLNNYTEGFPILKQLDMKATINYITSKLGSEYYFNVDQMKEMKASGLISIQSHTVSHLDLNTLDDARIDSELLDSKQWFDQQLNQDTSVLCYPAGRYDERVISSVEKNGYKMAITTEPGYAKKSDGLFTLKRVRVSPGYTGDMFGDFLLASQP